MRILKATCMFYFCAIFGGCAAYALPGADESRIEVARNQYQSTFDTIKVASAHCLAFNKLAVLRRAASPLDIIYADKYECVDPKIDSESSPN